MHLFRLAVCCLVLGFAVVDGAHAEFIPDGSQNDPRVRVMDYKPLELIKLSTYYGVSTFVQFAQTESIRDVAVGDEGAWNIVPRGNRLFIKPRAKHADTNVTVVTDRRVYHFALVVEKFGEKDSNAWRSKNLVYALHFRYPLEEAQTQASLLEQRAREVRGVAEQELLKLRLAMAVDVPEIRSARPVRSSERARFTDFEVNGAAGDAALSSGLSTSVEKESSAAGAKGGAAKIARIDSSSGNADYWIAGSPEISPTAIRDDGQFTYLTFSNNRDMPAVYASDKDGVEALINTNVNGNMIVAHRVLPYLTLRKGDLAVCVENRSFNWDAGRDNITGTVSSGVVRVVKELE